MPMIESHDGTSLFCRRWGDGPPIVFLHGWAMSSEAWQVAMLRVVEAGFQAVAYDRRGHGRSDDPGRGYDYDSLADDLAAVMEELELKDVTFVGHSMGCGEITRYLSRYGGERVSRAVMVAPFLPYPLKTADNPDGVADLASLQAMRQMLATSFAGWLAAAAPGAFTSAASPELVAQTVRQMLQSSLQAAIACNVAGAEADMRAELASLDTPTLILHGDQDGSCPLELTGRKVEALMRDCRLKVYPGATHTLVVEQAAEMVDDILAFVHEGATARTLERV